MFKPLSKWLFCRKPEQGQQQRKPQQQQQQQHSGPKLSFSKVVVEEGEGEVEGYV
jgi:hypothetical protein